MTFQMLFRALETELCEKRRSRESVCARHARSAAALCATRFFSRFMQLFDSRLGSRIHERGALEKPHEDGRRFCSPDEIPHSRPFQLPK